MTSHNDPHSPSGDEKDKKVVGGSFAISLLVHGMILLLIGSIIIVPGVVKKMTQITAVAPPPTVIPEPPKMEESPDVKSDDGGGSPITDTPENVPANTSKDTDATVDALTVVSPTSTGPSMNASPGASSANVGAFTSGRGGSGGGTGTGIGKGAGAGKGTFFGSTEKLDNSLIGKFYDLKQTTSQKPTLLGAGGWDAQACAQNGIALHEFVHSGFSAATLSKYFSPKLVLYAPYVFVPGMPADKAPEAFNVQNEVKPSHWVVHYQAMVAPQEDGVYRFTGFADDYLIIGVNGKEVLDGSLPIDWLEHGRLEGKTWIATEWRHHSAEPPYPVPRGRPANDSLHLNPGDWIEWKANDFKKLDIAFGECPGGLFCGYIFIERKGDKYEKGTNGAPILPIFRIGDAKVSFGPDVNPDTYPEFSYGPIFKAKHIQ